MPPSLGAGGDDDGCIRSRGAGCLRMGMGVYGAAGGGPLAPTRRGGCRCCASGVAGDAGDNGGSADGGWRGVDCSGGGAAAGLYGMSADELLQLLWQCAGLRALEFAPALPHMAASHRYMQLTPHNLAAWVSLLVDLEVQSPARLLAPCPAFLLIPLEGPHCGGGDDGGQDLYDSPAGHEEHGGRDESAAEPAGGASAGLPPPAALRGGGYAASCARFVRHLRDVLLMEEQEVFGLLSRLPSLALVEPESVDAAIVYLSLLLKSAGAGHRLGLAASPTDYMPPEAAPHPTGVAPQPPLAARPRHDGQPPNLRQRLQQPSQPTPQRFQPPSSLSEEAELDLALYRCLRRAPGVLAMPRDHMSYTLQRLSYDGAMGHTEMCRLLCAVPELLLAAAEELRPPPQEQEQRQQHEWQQENAAGEEQATA
ncbi:hypothetical protein TSOC_003024 [Tetrabaena socialis]|uniref:Uncharacterized protein n=1 Tax=Tetrabaena socialis TaxID=47790 RepID=A0A2J8ACL6_9CHLO|nr:hypothetical protein TSOC_003024 [Tetrabaena socialis]|eukprot:PNH10264.1 hypothetical protein TSOC_003024 [Tetrabaena socialis]